MLKAFLVLAGGLFLANGSYAESLVDELSDVYLSSDKALERILELYEIPAEKGIVRATDKSGFVQPSSGYYIETVRVEGAFSKPFQLHIRYPETQVSVVARPVVFIAAGLYSSAETLNLLPRTDNVIFVMFEYSVDKKDPLKMFKSIDQSLKAVPAQMIQAMQWVQEQPWAEPQQFHTVGVSLGSLFLPLSLRIAESRGISAQSVIFAYGGADLSSFIDSELQDQVGHREREIIVDVLSVVLKSVDPTVHLPFLKSQFLIVYGQQDELIPRQSTQALMELTPEPKTIVGIEGGHINTEEWEILSDFAAVLKSWYQELGVISAD